MHSLIVCYQPQHKLQQILNKFCCYFIDSYKNGPHCPWPTTSKEVTCIGSGGSIESTLPEKQTAHHCDDVCGIVVMVVSSTFCTISTIGIPWSESFCSHWNPYSGQAVKWRLTRKQDGCASQQFVTHSGEEGVLSHITVLHTCVRRMSFGL